MCLQQTSVSPVFGFLIPFLRLLTIPAIGAVVFLEVNDYLNISDIVYINIGLVLPICLLIMSMSFWILIPCLYYKKCRGNRLGHAVETWNR